jgi:hypothetical protein
MRLEDFDNDEDRIIQDRLKQKNWNEIWTNDGRFLKSCAEFVNGYEAMGRIGPCVSILALHESQKIRVLFTCRKNSVH